MRPPPQLADPVDPTRVRTLPRHFAWIVDGGGGEEGRRRLSSGPPLGGEGGFNP